MKFIPLGKSIFVLLLMACLAAEVLAMDAKDTRPEAKPVALVGSRYGSYEVRCIVRNIFDHEDWDFEEKGSFLPADEFKNYSLVILAHSQERSYTAEEQTTIREYLENGGHLLLIHRIPFAMADETSQEAFADWLGMTFKRIKLEPESVEIADDPLLKGVIDPDAPRPSWIQGIQGMGRVSPDVEILIGSGEDGLVARRKVGKGWVVYLGSEVFRLRAAKSEHLEASDSYLTLIRNIIAAANPLLVGDWRAFQNAKWRTAGKRYLLWNREWQRGTENEAIFLPPLPADDERISSLPVNLAMDEYEAVQVNLTDLGSGGLVTWKVDLGGLSPEALSVFIQDRAPNPFPGQRIPPLPRNRPFG